MFKLKTNIINWLQSITVANIKAIDPLKIFKKYRPLDRGNSKLNSNILSFSLLPVVTCESRCKGCYDLRSLRHASVRKKRYVNTSMAVHNQTELMNLIIKQVVNSRTCEYVRLHVGGDIFSDSYLDMWRKITSKVSEFKPDIKFYTYTKTNYTKKLESIGINVVKSLYGKDYNFGSLDYVKDMIKKHGGVICPATLGKVPNHFCGNKCKACMSRCDVFFIEH